MNWKNIMILKKKMKERMKKLKNRVFFSQISVKSIEYYNTHKPDICIFENYFSNANINH
jgi:hypothetical protein